MRFLTSHLHLVPCLIAILTLFGVMMGWSYASYPVLHSALHEWIVCAAAVLAAILSYRQRTRIVIMHLFAATAILFNPFIPPFRFSRESWLVVDALCIILFGWFALSDKPKALATT